MRTHLSIHAIFRFETVITFAGKAEITILLVSVPLPVTGGRTLGKSVGTFADVLIALVFDVFEALAVKDSNPQQQACDTAAENVMRVCQAAASGEEPSY